MADQYNPIQWVAWWFVGESIPTEGTEIPCPSKYQWQIQDVSQSDAGRTEDGTMHKLMIGSAIKLILEWQNLPTNKVTTILQAFATEYFAVRYLDPLRGGYRTSIFYAGDKTSPAYNTQMGLWSNISFNLIERGIS